MNNHPSKVSVVIPTYNQADLLQNALNSVIHQTEQDWEVIVIDNNSQDTTKEVVESCHDTRIRYVSYSNNGIIAASRNYGITLAVGNYIAFLDSDDLWYPSKLDSCLNLLGGGADAVCHGLRIRRDGIPGESFLPDLIQHDLYHHLLYNGNSSIATSAVMLKKECLTRFGRFSQDPEIVTAEDYELWLRLSKNGIRWGFIPEVLGEYRIHGKNASGNIRKQMQAEETVVKKYFDEENSFSSSGDLLKRKKRRMMIALRAGKRSLDSGFFRDAVSYALRGIAKIWS